MTETYHRADLSIDQTLALKRAATRLSGEFDGTFGKETIDRFLHSSYDEFAGRATIPNFLPLLAERFARQRLKALAKIEQPDTNATPVVLFLCTHNAGRSQMAMGFLQHLAGDGAVAWSGGSRTEQHHQSRRGRGDGRAWDRHLPRVPQAVDRRDGPRRRRGRHDGLR